MRSLSILLILCHLQLVVETVVASPQQKQPDMTVTITKQNTLIANEGSKHGIIIGSIYDIRQNGVSIGRAVVRVVRETMWLKAFRNEYEKLRKATNKQVLTKESFIFKTMIVF